MNGSDISLFVAFGGGMLSFLSPCVLPLVPAYLCFLSGASLAQLCGSHGEEVAEVGSASDASAIRVPVRPVLPALAFVLGFSTVFVMLGAGASSLSQILVKNLDIFSKVAGLVIMLLGLHFIGVLRFKFLDRELRFQTTDTSHGLVGAYVIGLAFAFGWTPCIGPVLGTILTLAANQQQFGQGVLLLVVYSLGLGIPFLLAVMAINPFMRFMQRARRYMRVVELSLGLLLLLTGGAMFAGVLQNLGFYLLETFPWLGEIG